MGIPIDRLTESEAVARIISDWRQGRGGWVVTPNIDHLRILHEQPELQESVTKAATLLLADGMPLVWASRLQGTPLPERVPGSDLIASLTAAAAEAGASVFLLGGNPGAGERAAAMMRAANPGLKIAGILCPPFGFEQDPALFAQVSNCVAAARPDLVYSCFGFPKQEWVIAQLRRELPTSWFLGLGGSLSMVSGEFKRAPVWMRKTGLEWVCRLAQEPRRLSKRYLVGDAPFALRLFASAARHRWISARYRRRMPHAAPNPALEHSGAATGASASPDGGGAQQLDDVTRERILNWYASMGVAARWRRFTARLKQLAWIALLGWAGTGKRLVDVTGSLALLIALSPVLLTFGALVKLTSPGPVLFRQIRVGKRGRLFKIYKFRSMWRDAEDRIEELLPHNEMAGGVVFKLKHDPRRTPVGSFMRRWSIDELPQLWNVLRGDMSLVGPRPPLPAEVLQYTLSDRRRLDAIPGVTCIWQVSGRNEIPFDRQVELDVEYIESQSLSLDLKLMLQTVPAVLQRRGAY